MISAVPLGLEAIDPFDRIYPSSWKDYAILCELRSVGCVICPRCNSTFTRRSELRLLEADHIHPFSRGGLSTWKNLQLLCRPCNRSKSDEVVLEETIFGARSEETRRVAR